MPVAFGSSAASPVEIVTGWRVADFTCDDQLATNASAKASLDMSRMRDVTMEGQDAACGQMLNAVDPNNPAMSRIFLTTDPAQMNTHTMFRFKFANAMLATQFQMDITPWITAEK